MISISINLYSFSELSENAKQRAIREQREFLLSTLQPDFIDGIIDWSDPEKMEMYRAEFNYIEENDEPCIESIETNDYLFYFNGEIAEAVTYCGNHPRTGETDITIHGETYTRKEAQL